MENLSSAGSPNRFPHNLPPGWKKHLEQEVSKTYFEKLTKFLGKEFRSGKKIFPPQDKILRALQALDYEKVKVVILGQDPYHGPDQAVGLCFAVPNGLQRKPPSLVNIFKEIESDLQTKVDRTKSELSQWVAQGVLLLNTVLTVRMGEANSHKGQGWEEFTNEIISLLNQREDPILFILWGAPARQKKLLITNPQHKILESAHPSPLSAHNGFFGSRPFSRANSILQQWGKAPVRWELTE